MDNISKDKLDIMIQLSGDALIKHNLEVGVASELPDVQFPQALNRRVMRMIRHESNRPVYNEAFVYAKRTAAVFLVALSLCFALAMSVEAVRVAFWNAIVEWFDDYIAVMFVTEDEPPMVIKEYYEPKLLPLEAERRITEKSGAMYTIEYYVDEKIVLIYRQCVLQKHSIMHDEAVNVLEYNINDNIGVLIQLPHDILIINWADNEYRYELRVLDSNIDIDMVSMIASSIKK